MVVVITYLGFELQHAVNEICWGKLLKGNALGGRFDGVVSCKLS